MLVDLYRYVTDNRREIFQKLDIKITEKMYEKARSIWHELPNEHCNAKLAGIDSSWNLIPYHGFYLYAVAGVSVDSNGSLLTEPRYEIDIDTLEFQENNNTIYNPRVRLESKGMEFEYMLIKDTMDKVDLTLVDGSLQARMYVSRSRRTLTFNEYANIKRDDLIFISKRSESRSILGGPAGDIYYFDHATYKAGYSYPPHYDKGIAIIYARLSDHLPCLKIEFPTKIDEDIILDRLVSIKTQSISGYPHVLKLAHDRCKISNEDMYNIESLLGIIEVRGREVLEY